MSLSLARKHTVDGANPLDSLPWGRRNIRMLDSKGKVIFEQEGAEFPLDWSQFASELTADKYFRGHVPNRETSLSQPITRIAGWYSEMAWGDDYLDSPEQRRIFFEELQHGLLHQRYSFNSPVWFNVGRPGVDMPRVSACFTISVDDDLGSIQEWIRTEAFVFKLGSGAGTNLSRLREAGAPLRDGGWSAGPLPFIRTADTNAGALASGGANRRAAKLVALNCDHPDIMDFIDCKRLEEEKIRLFRSVGLDIGMNGADNYNVQYQNANNSVGLVEGFVAACRNHQDWHLRSVLDRNKITRTLPARDLLRRMAEATWNCACPGAFYLDNMNRWHTSPETGYLDKTNPCGEFVRNDSSCNLASLRLTRFYSRAHGFNIEEFVYDVGILITAMDVSVSNAEYPTDKIRHNANRYRELGLGFADLGALLMRMGLPYDSEEGRIMAACVTALMTGAAWLRSAELAREVGPYPGWKNGENSQAHLRVMYQHREALDTLLAQHAVPLNLYHAACKLWDEAIALGERHGFRNAQVSLLAPTGTIGLVMDCDTTGVEPSFSLIAFKKTADGATTQIVNRSVPEALRNLGYSEIETEAITQFVFKHNTVVGAPHLQSEHYPIFDCAVGERAIHYMGHLLMMAACQPFLCGAISKTVNLPEGVTVEEIMEIFLTGHELGLKDLALYRDNSKAYQPLNAKKAEPEAAPAQPVQVAVPVGHVALPFRRPGDTLAVRIGNMKFYLRTGNYPDGRLGEIFLDIVGAGQGTTLAGLIDALAIAISKGLQGGVPLQEYVDVLRNHSFEPNGITNDPDIPFAVSLIGYVMDRLAVDYLPPPERQGMGVWTRAERMQELDGYPPWEGPQSTPGPVDAQVNAPLCQRCGCFMVRRGGPCWRCDSCGANTGCS